MPAYSLHKVTVRQERTVQFNSNGTENLIVKVFLDGYNILIIINILKASNKLRQNIYTVITENESDLNQTCDSSIEYPS